MKLFGYEISKIIDKKKPSEGSTVPSFSAPIENDGTSILTSSNAAGYYGQILDIDGASLTNEKDIVLKCRSASTQPECDTAISDIVNAAIVSDSDGAPVNIVLDKLDQPDSIKKKIREEFNTILKLLSFNYNGYDIFRRWYIDGKLYYHLMIDNKKPKEGIKEIRSIDPLKIKKIKEVTSKIDKATGIKTAEVTGEYFLYSEDFSSSTGAGGIKIDPNTVVYVPSGILDESGKYSSSYLYKSVKLVNQLRMMEDALVIYRISRAPERRIFYIDIGNLPKGKAEEYVQGIMAKYRNKLIYDANTGEIRDDRKSMSMLEDFWLPRREGGRGTEITTLPGGDNLSQIEDVIFFQKKLYRSLNIPINRLEGETGFNMGRVSEISREEVKFQKFINRLRKKFAVLFIDTLRMQLLLKGIITPEDWTEIKENISIDYIEDNFFSELKDFEIMKERISMLDTVSSHIGKYYSDKWVRSNILNQSDEEIEKMDEEIAAEKPSEEAAPEESSGEEESVNFESTSDDTYIDNSHKEEIQEAQLKMIESMTRILEE
jgi:hypothetical protein